MNVTLIDSPVANVANIARALRHAGADLDITSEPAAIARGRKIVLPGVGSFVAAMRWLEETGIDDALRDALFHGATLLGICVGHQLLFDASHEMGSTRGLGFVRGEVRKFEGALPIPQIGWNRVSFDGEQASRLQLPGILPGSRSSIPSVARDESPRQDAPAKQAGRLLSSALFEGIAEGTSFYFVNSYAASNVEAEIARADYGGSFTAAVETSARKGRVFGVQFHPEKSSAAGLQVLGNFVRLAS